jgi:hypothetical protein
LKNHNDYPEEFLVIMVVASNLTAPQSQRRQSVISWGAFYALLDLLVLAARIPGGDVRSE